MATDWCILCSQDQELKHGQVYKVKRITDKEKADDGSCWLYLVEWVGWREATWEPIECLRGMCDAALEAFHRSRAP